MNELTPEERADIIAERLAWRNVFSSADGRRVFRKIATECYFFNDNISPDNLEAIILNNYFKRIMERLGCGENPDKTIDAILGAILEQPMTSEGVD